MADPNFRCQVTNAMVAALPPIPDVTCISNIAPDMADAMLSTATDLAPRSTHPREAQGHFAGPGVEDEMNAAWQHKRGDEKTPSRRTPIEQRLKGREDVWKTFGRFARLPC